MHLANKNKDGYNNRNKIVTTNNSTDHLKPIPLQDNASNLLLI